MPKITTNHDFDSEEPASYAERALYVPAFSPAVCVVTDLHEQFLLRTLLVLAICSARAGQHGVESGRRCPASAGPLFDVARGGEAYDRGIRLPSPAIEQPPPDDRPIDQLQTNIRVSGEVPPGAPRAEYFSENGRAGHLERARLEPVVLPVGSIGPVSPAAVLRRCAAGTLRSLIASALSASAERSQVLRQHSVHNLQDGAGTAQRADLRVGLLPTR